MNAQLTAKRATDEPASAAAPVAFKNPGPLSLNPNRANGLACHLEAIFARSGVRPAPSSILIGPVPAVAAPASASAETPPTIAAVTLQPGMRMGNLR